MHTNSRPRTNRGFSLLEVLVAVVLLSIGLLALASLQLSMIRASSSSKEQSVALSLAKDKLEQLRDYQSLAAYQALTDYPAPTCPGDPECVTVGGTTYSRGWDVNRYGYNTVTGLFTAIGDTGALPAGYGSNNEFKRVLVTINWTDAAGAQGTIGVEDAMGALDPADSALLGKLNKVAVARKPKVIIYNPASTEGVIPIAIGNGSDTAATNPTPEVTGRGTNNERVVETRFDVLTYAAITNTNTATAQNRVETAIVGCTCNVNNGGGVTGLRPTYWDGEKYTVPSPATFVAPAGVATGLTVSESPRCTICCRDHHDNSTAAPSRIGAGEAKFDPRRTTHDHYEIGTITAVNTGTAATGDYTEACRLIRVDGSFRVAADMFNDHMDLLETKAEAGVPEHLPVPSADATTNYAGSAPLITPVVTGFVISYMNSRFVSGTAYNTRATMTPSPALHPDSVTMSKSIYDYRWQHARGLYIDYLEPAAIAAIAKAKADCLSPPRLVACTAGEKQTAILKLLPFTSINLTEIANWRSYGTSNNNSLGTESQEIVTVTNDDFLESIVDVQPARGNALPGFGIPASPANGNWDGKASAEIFESNSGLALLLDPIDPTAAEFTPLTDGQVINVSGNVAVSANAGTYSVTFTKGSNANPNGYFFSGSSAAFPQIRSNPNVSRCNYATKGGSKPNPYTCGNYALGTNATPQPINIVLQKYNYTDTSRTSTTPLTCTGIESDRSYAGPYTVNYCKNYGVDSTTFPVTVSPSRTITTPYTVANAGLIGETTTIAFADLRAGDAITVPLRFESESTTSATCTYQVATANNGNKTYTYFVTPAACP